MTRARDISNVITDANLGGTLDVSGAFTSPGIDDNADAVALTIDSSERIGIGTNSPSEKLEINTGTGNIGAKIVSTDSLALLAYKDNSTSDVVLSGASGDNFAVSHDILFTNASKGIYLGVTSATASNLLSDYEEGTWTPTVNTGTGYSGTTFGNYTKIGRLVFINANVETTSTSSAGNVISGLPFTSLADSNSDGNLSIGYYSGLNEHVIWIGGYVLDGTTNIYLVGNADGHTGTTIQKNGFSAFSGNTRVMFSGVYVTAS